MERDKDEDEDLVSKHQEKQKTGMNDITVVYFNQ